MYTQHESSRGSIRTQNGHRKFREGGKRVRRKQNDNRGSRHDRDKKGSSKGKPCGEDSQLLSASNKGNEEQLELAEWFIFID